MKWLSWTLDHPIAVTLFFVLVLIVGVVCTQFISIELSPHLELPKMTISASWPNTSPVTMESQVTAPLESVVQSIRGVTHVLSQTYEGYCVIVADFAKNTNMDLAELEINEKISQLKETLPRGVSWPQVERSVPEAMRWAMGALPRRGPRRGRPSSSGGIKNMSAFVRLLACGVALSSVFVMAC